VALASLLALLSLRAEVVFDNTSSYLATTYFSNDEFGDEVSLTKAVTNLTEFGFSYLGEFDSTGRETFRLRLYANDGPDTDPGPKTIPGPGSLPYESGPHPIYSGFNSILASGFSIQAPQTITWTVQFEGLLGTPENRAGLVLANPPSMGRSFDDFWLKTGNSWTLHRFNGNPVANFVARFATGSSVVSVGQPTRQSNGDQKIEIQGPSGLDFVLEFSANALDWVPLHTNRFSTQPFTFTHQGAGAFATPFYRASLLPVAARLVSTSAETTGGIRIQFEGPLGSMFNIEGSGDGILWTPVHQGAFPAGIGEWIDRAGKSATRYRLNFLGAIPAVIVADGVVNRNLQLAIFGNPGQRFELQASEDFESWKTVHADIFDYTVGQAVWVDTNTVRFPQRFYRTVLPAA